MGLRGQLEALAADNGFTIEGLDWVGPEPARHAEGTLAERLKRLLEDYNYVIVQGRPGNAPEQVRISSRKTDGARSTAGRADVDTVRIGMHHQVEAAITGPNAIIRTVPLIVDTGASTLVLPESMISELGLTPEDLQDGKSQAAGGTVPVRIGVLQSVRVGAVSVQNVQVSFIADRKLRGTKLLGMSFLQHFRMTIDDAKNELILMAK